MRFDPSTLETLRSLPIESVLDRCQVRRQGKAVFCPFHKNERTPAAHVYPGRLYCFACQQSWDAIALYRQLFQLDFVGAVQALASDFGIAVQALGSREADKHARAHRAAIQEAEQIVAARDAYRRYLIDRRNEAYDTERLAIRLAQELKDPSMAELFCEIVFLETGIGLETERQIERLEQASAQELFAWFQEIQRSKTA